MRGGHVGNDPTDHVGFEPEQTRVAVPVTNGRASLLLCITLTPRVE